MKIMKIKRIKRLIKKAEFVEGIESDDTYSGMLSIYKNPTAKEIEEAKSESNLNSIRGTINNGVIYCWNGSLLHSNVYEEFVPEESFRFAYEPKYSEWIFDLHDHFTFKQGMNKFLELKSTLQQFGNFGENDEIIFFYASDDSNKYTKFNNSNSSIDAMSSDCISFPDINYAENFINYMNSHEN